MNYVLKWDIIHRPSADIITIPTGSKCITKEYFEENGQRYCKVEWLEPIIEDEEEDGSN